MIIIKTADLLTDYLLDKQNEGLRIGFVPTMGALHKGHTSLIKAAAKNNELVVCSIFINPVQFTNQADLLHYPKTLEADIEALVAAGCGLLFLPPVAEVYPPSYRPVTYPLGQIETVLEGRYRPGHFQGVCQVVHRLVQLVMPTNLYLGLKDYQQCKVIETLLKLIGNKAILHQIPTSREADGLAMSSRNLRLSEAGRRQAPQLYHILSAMRQNLYTQTFAESEKQAAAQLEANGFRVDYVSICDAETLLPPTHDGAGLMVLAAAYLDEVRLIDNLRLN